MLSHRKSVVSYSYHESLDSILGDIVPDPGVGHVDGAEHVGRGTRPNSKIGNIKVKGRVGTSCPPRSRGWQK